MKHGKLLTGLCVCLLLFCSEVRAELIGGNSYPPSADVLTSDSDVVAEMKISSVDYDHNELTNQDVSNLPLVDGGTYVLRRIKNIKAEAPDTLTIEFPPLYAWPYDFSLQHPRKGDTLLIFLKQRPSGYAPTSLKTPYYPISLPQNPTYESSDAKDIVITDLCYTLADSKLRMLASSILEKIIDANVVVAMSKYIDDPNGDIKCHVLNCMATNGQVEAIPMIAKYADRLATKGRSTFSVNALFHYKSTAAVPYLNPLLWNSVYSVRSSAMRALYSLANDSSTPYLILGLRDPANHYEIAGAAYNILVNNILHKPQLTLDRTQFLQKYDAEVQTYSVWWTADLLGQHLSKDPADLPEQRKEAAQPIPDDVAAINPLLFQPYFNLRERAMKALQTKADYSSIPYLVLTLQDPDNDVSYGAYVLLRQLIGVPSAPLSKADYSANQQTATKPLYSWWSDELMGKHSRQALPDSKLTPDTTPESLASFP